MKRPVLFYGGPFSNFVGGPFVIDGERFRTVEHYFQSRKTLDRSWRREIASEPDTWRAKALGQMCPMRPDWEAEKEGVMLHALRAKFAQPEFREALLATGDREIIENSPTDYYWGCGEKKTGKNRLGILLMQLREEIRAGQAAVQ